MIVFSHIGGLPVEEVLAPLMSGGVGFGMLLALAAAAFHRRPRAGNGSKTRP
jgi:hypothetical protein